jgi:hypothetical protein
MSARNDADQSVRRAAATAARIATIDWERIASDLDGQGHAVTPTLLTPEQCRALAALYERDAAFRSRVVMQRHGFGQGEYSYLKYPLPAQVQGLREAIYPRLAPLANRWRERLKQPAVFPPTIDAFLSRCHDAGQTRPTPLILKYGPGDYNCLHQDLYGERVFPVQMTILLSDPATEFDGGEFMLVEQRPRRQSRGEVVTLRQGEAVIFAVHQRPVPGKRGFYRVNMRHGVSRLRRGRRFTLGVIFHDAT